MSYLSRLKDRRLQAANYLKREVMVSGRPTELTIELTNLCDLECVYCPRKKMSRPKGVMDFALFKKIIDESGDFLEFVDLDLYGEPTLHPKIMDMLSYCRGKRIKTSFSTNMNNVDAKMARELMRAGLSMMIMNIGSSKDEYESTRKGAEYERTRANIENTLNMKEGRLIKVVQMVCAVGDKKGIYDFRKAWRDKRADVIRIKPYRDFIGEQDRGANSPSDKKSRRKPCIMLWKKFSVCWDGVAVLCCVDYNKSNIIGDVKNDLVLDIWNSQAMQHYRQLHVGGKQDEITLCRNCPEFRPKRLLILGSIFVDSLQMRKLLYHFDNLFMMHNIHFLEYT